MAKTEELLTLTEIHKQTGMSMVTLRKYRDEHGSRIPSQGEGRKMRFPKEAVEVFVAIKREGRSKERNSASQGTQGKGKAKKRVRSAAKSKSKGLLTMTEIHERTGMSMITLRKYRDQHGDRIPSEGTGRTMRFYPEAVEIFKEIKQEGRSHQKRGSRKAKKKSPKKVRSRASKGTGDLLTLSAISQLSGISMLTLRKYRDQQGDRIPSVGQGRTMRFRPEAVAVFQEIKREGRGRRRRVVVPQGQSQNGRVSRTHDKGFSLRQVAEKTGIPQWKVVYLVRKYLERIPHFMEGKYRFFPKESLKVFQAIHSETQRGKAGKGASDSASRSLHKGLSLREIQRQTGIAYGKLNQLVKKYLDHIPHRGEGRNRTYQESAVEVFKRLHLNPPKEMAAKVVKRGKETAHLAVKATESMGANLVDSLSSLETLLKSLEQRLSSVEEALMKPLKVSIKRDD